MNLVGLDFKQIQRPTMAGFTYQSQESVLLDGFASLGQCLNRPCQSARKDASYVEQYI